MSKKLGLRKQSIGGILKHDRQVIKLAVRSYLQDVKAKISALKYLESEIAKTRESMEGVNSPSVNVQAGSSGDRVTKGLIKLHELETLWNTAVVEYSDIAAQAYLVCFNNGLNRQIVWLHEVERKSWADIGKKYGYSERNIRRIAENGYSEIYYAMPEIYRVDAFPNAAPKS